MSIEQAAHDLKLAAGDDAMHAAGLLHANAKALAAGATANQAVL